MTPDLQLFFKRFSSFRMHYNFNEATSNFGTEVAFLTPEPLDMPTFLFALKENTTLST